jgi:hypothetical protein
MFMLHVMLRVKLKRLLLLTCWILMFARLLTNGYHSDDDCQLSPGPRTVNSIMEDANLVVPDSLHAKRSSMEKELFLDAIWRLLNLGPVWPNRREIRNSRNNYKGPSLKTLLWFSPALSILPILKTLPGKWALMMILLLSGDVELNPGPDHEYNVGDQLLCWWNGKLFKVKCMEKLINEDNSINYKVHYMNWSSKFDQLVDESRLLVMNDKNLELKRTIDEKEKSTGPSTPDRTLPGQSPKKTPSTVKANRKEKVKIAPCATFALNCLKL